MAKFAYRAKKYNGESVTGEIDAPELAQARRLVSQQKMIVIDIQPALANKLGAREAPPPASAAVAGFRKIKNDLFPKATTEEIMLLFQQLQTIYAVGISLVKGLQILAEQAENKYLKEVLESAIRDVSEGRAVSEALAQYPELFDEITINLLKAGEASGQLDELLERIAVVYQQRIEQQQKIKSATFYPKIVVGMITVVFAVIVYFVIPKFKEFFGKFGGELPMITRVLMGTSDFFTSYWYLVLGIVVSVYWGYQAYTSTPQGLRRLHQLFMKLPYFGKIFVQSDLVTFCLILEVLVRSGIPITQCLPIVSGSIKNVLLREDLARIKTGIESGRTLRAGLDESKIIPSVASNLIGVGEEAGSLEKALNRLHSYYKLQVDDKLGNLSKAIEPILLLFVFGMVLVLALAVFLPMWKMNTMIKK